MTRSEAGKGEEPMAIRQADRNAAQETAPRKPYRQPILRVHGTLGALTKGSGGTMTDGTMQNKA